MASTEIKGAAARWADWVDPQYAAGADLDEAAIQKEFQAFAHRMLAQVGGGEPKDPHVFSTYMTLFNRRVTSACDAYVRARQAHGSARGAGAKDD